MIDRRFFIVAKSKHRCYCAYCGKIQLQDYYNYKKHGNICGFTDDDNFTPVREGVTYGYRWSKEGQKLRFSVCLPRLILRPGFSDRYLGGCWDSVFEAELSLAQKKVEILKNETDIDFDEWIARADKEDLVRIHAGSDGEAIRSAFPGIIDIWDLKTFINLYRKKGYRYVPLLTEETARHLVEQGFSDAQKTDLALKNRKEEKNELIPCKASLFKEKSTGAMILRLIMDCEDGPQGFLFSRKYYVYTYRAYPNLRSLFSRRLEMDKRSRDIILRFATVYPGYYLREYLETDENGNVLIPLLASDYHVLYELLAKAGLANVACHAELCEWKVPAESIRNLKDTFGLPVSILRRLDREAVSRENLNTARRIYEADASYLNFNCLRESMMRILYYVDPTNPEHPHRYLDWDGPLTKQQILRILRYFQDHPDYNYFLYRDYLNLCHYENIFDYGLLPDNLQAAHDTMMRLKSERDNANVQETFQQQLDKPEYQKLATNSDDEDNEVFEEDEFLILLPVESDDLYREGYAMHNCVRSYTNAVCRGITRIVFLRKKDEPGKSLGTIEVSSNNHLVQAKAFANGHLGRQAQLFVRKWAKVKKLTIRTRDLSETG